MLLNLTENTTKAKKVSASGNTVTNPSGFKKRTNSYKAVLDYTIEGIPCLIGVVDYFKKPPHKGSAQSCDSDLDYYGYEEVDYLVLDRKGYKAAWLAKKVDDQENSNIIELISRYMND